VAERDARQLFDVFRSQATHNGKNTIVRGLHYGCVGRIGGVCRELFCTSIDSYARSSNGLAKTRRNRDNGNLVAGVNSRGDLIISSNIAGQFKEIGKSLRTANMRRPLSRRCAADAYGVGLALRWARGLVEVMSKATDSRKNYLRRAIGAGLCLLPLLLFVVSAAVHNRTHSIAATWLLIPAAALGLFNFYLSFVRPVLYRLCHGSMDGFRFVSGIPGIGTVLVFISGVVGFGSLSVALLGIVTIFVDTGGSFWFLVATWHDKSLWDV
jgi:hypothetical protein